MAKLTGEEFGALFNQFRTSAFRFEALQTYRSPSEADAYNTWQQTGIAGPHEIWCEIIREAHARGARMDRVRVVLEPPTKYTQWELLVYRWSQEAGEHIRILTTQPGYEPGTDFWLFDDRIGVLMAYDRDGRFHGGHLTNDLGTLRAIRDHALHESIPLTTYMTPARS